MKNNVFFLVCIALFLSLYACDDNNETFQEQQAELNAFAQEIEAMARVSRCDGVSQCRSIAFGSKPCGGPWSYLVYSASINTDRLEQMVRSYNAREKAFNIQWNLVSDCEMVLPPTRIECVENECVPVYED
ncbi:hypothetical protein [Ascidiimonas aurantiaca]|uniref:hypothetical protein n=1 Tax=Ascidiimonas aurantiaca TaxID=1685432 RepID=UPI0030EB9255